MPINNLPKYQQELQNESIEQYLEQKANDQI